MPDEDTFYNSLLCFAGIISLVCYFVGVYWYHKVWKRWSRVTAGLLTFGRIMASCLIFMPMSSIGTSVYCSIWDDFESMTCKQVRMSLGFATQIIDQSTMIISLDCVVASVRQNQMPLLQTKVHGIVAAIVCLFISILIACFYFSFGINFPVPFTGLVSMMHVMCFAIETLLLHINISRHKKIALNYTLFSRLNLARNIKLLRLFCPYLFLITILTSIGPLVFLYSKYCNSSDISRVARVSIHYTCYNATLIIMTLMFIWSSVKRNRSSRQRGDATIKTVTGRVINLRETIDDHFQQLNGQWNKH